jgi:hypothetical protein
VLLITGWNDLLLAIALEIIVVAALVDVHDDLLV